MRLIYNAISYLFFPGAMAVLGIYSIMLFELGDIWAPIALFLVIPVAVLFIFSKIGWVTDIHVTDRKQRTLTYLIAIVFAGFYVLISHKDKPYFAQWGWAVLVTLVSLVLINLIWIKASAHMAGAAGFLALCLHLCTVGQPIYWLITAFCICVLVYTARKGLSAHSHKELIAGFCLGFFVTFAVFQLWN